MTANWTTLFVRLNGQMKRIGNINLQTGDMSLYSEGYEYYESGDLYYVDSNGDYQPYYK